MKKNIIIFSLIITGLFAVGIVSYNSTTNNTNYLEAKYIADFSDSRKVAGFADNIFIGKIIKNNSVNKIGKEKFYRSEFEVEVLYNIKGNLKGNIISSQSIGYDKKGNLIKSKGSKLMKEGEIYILATRGDAPYKIMSHSNGSYLLTSDKKMNKLNIKKLIKSNKKVKEWKNAYKNEVLYQGNYKISTEKNAYKKLSKQEKNEFENIESGFIK